MPSPLADPAGFKIPVPPLPLDRLLAGKGACDVIQPLTGGSDVSSRSRLPLSAHTTPASPVAGSSGPAAGLPLGNLRSDDDPGSPNSAIDCSTPRTDLNMATLTLHSPPSAAYKTPKRTPRMSPHSPHSPSMMSPLRLVGTRSPCSRRIVGSQRITGDKVVPIRNEGQSDRATGGVLQRGPGAVSKPPVQRALPFSPQRPTRGANAPSKVRAAFILIAARVCLLSYDVCNSQVN